MKPTSTTMAARPYWPGQIRLALVSRCPEINGPYKAEVIHRRGPWRKLEAVECGTLEWVDWFNHRWLLEPIGNIPPAEAEDQYHAAPDNIDMAARLTTQRLRQTWGGSSSQ